MKEFKGTQGEWEYNKDSLSNGWTSVNLAGTNHEIAVCYTGLEQKDSNELIANAKLIAAAPELLKALQIYLNAGCKDTRREASVIAKKAISKALD